MISAHAGCYEAQLDCDVNKHAHLRNRHEWSSRIYYVRVAGILDNDTWRREYLRKWLVTVLALGPQVIDWITIVIWI